MTVRADILAGRAVILINIQDTIDKQLRTIRSKLRVFANSMNEIGGDIFRGSAAGTVAAFFPIKDFVQFQDSLLFLEANLRETGVDVKNLESYIRDLGRTTSFTSREVAEAATVLAQAGFDAEIKPMLLPVLDLARGARVDLETSGRILSNVMSAYNMPAELAQEVASKLSTAARLGTTDIVLMSESLKYALATFRQLNVPLEDALGMITMLSNVSMRGSMAGTSLNTAFGELVTKKEELAKLKIGITDEDLQQPLKILIKLSEALKKMGVQEQQATLRDIFNIRGGRGIGGQTIQNLDDLNTIIQKIRASTDEARWAAEKMDSKLGGAFRRALSSVQEFSISLGETTEGPLSDIALNVQRMFESLGVIVKKNPVIAQTMLFLPPAALAASVAFLTLSSAMGKVILLIDPLLGLNRTIFMGIAAVVGTNIKTIKSLIDTITKLKISSGVGLKSSFVAVFSALPGYLSKTTMGVRFVFNELINSAKNAGAQLRLAFGPMNLANFPQQITPNIQPNKLTSFAQTDFLRPAIQQMLDFGPDISKQLEFNFEPPPGFKTLRDILEESSEYAKTLFRSSAFAEGVSGPERLAKAIASTVEVKGLPKQLEGQIAKNLKDFLGKTELNKVTDAFFQDAAKQLDFNFEPAQPMLPGFDDIVENIRSTNGKIINSYDDLFSNLKTTSTKITKLTQETPKAIAAAVKAYDITDELISGRPGDILDKPVKMMLGAATAPIKGTANAVKSLGGTAGKVFAAIGKVDWLATFTWGLTKSYIVMTKLKNASFAVVKSFFTLSGLINWVQILLLFGDKIPVVNDALSGLGKAMNNAFTNVSNTLKNVGAGLKVVGDGIRLIYTGNIEEGVTAIGEGFRFAGRMLTEGLANTWKQFLLDIEPGAAIIRNVFLGVLAVVDAIIASIGGIFSGIVTGTGILVKADGSLTEMFKSLFSPENLQKLFSAIIGGIESITLGIMGMMESVTSVLVSIKETFTSILQSLPGGSDKAEALDPRIAMSRELQQRLEIKRTGGISTESPDFEANLQRIEELQNLLDGYLDPLTAGFKGEKDKVKARFAEIQAGLQAMLEPFAKPTAINNTPPKPPDPNKVFGEFTALTDKQLELAKIGITEANSLANINFDPLDTLASSLEGQTELGTIMPGFDPGDGPRINTKELTPPQPNLPQKNAVSGLSELVASRVGDFMSTRGNKLQLQINRLDKERNELLKDIKDGVNNMGGENETFGP